MATAAGFGVKCRGHGSRMADELPGTAANQRAYVRIAFSDGYHYRWPLRDDSAAETLRNYIARDYMTDAQVAEAAGGVVLEAER